jgi:hypothetical protein
MLRQFAALWLVLLGGAALWRWLALGETRTAIVLGVLSLTVGVAGLIVPAVVRPLFVGLTVVTFPIGWVVSRAIVVALFAVIVTPLALVFRLTGRDALHLRRKNRDSYWAPKPPPRGLESYFRQS